MNGGAAEPRRGGAAELRLGVAGCGRIVERAYVPAALETAGVRLAAFADPDRARAAACREAWERGGGGESPDFGAAAELLEAAALDALLVAAPAAHHLELAEQAAAAGLPALVEKPPATDLDGAQRLAALRPQPLLAFNRRFLQGLELRDRVPAEGWLELELELRYRRAAWGAHEASDDALLDAGVHLLDLARFLTGAEPICVRDAALAPERAELELELTRGRARIRCATDRRHREAVTIRDRAGKVVAASSLGGLGGRLAALRGAPHPLALSIGRQLAALRELLRGGAAADGAAALGSGRDGAIAMAAVEAARRSARLDGAEVTVTPLGAPA